MAKTAQTHTPPYEVVVNKPSSNIASEPVANTADINLSTSTFSSNLSKVIDNMLASPQPVAINREFVAERHGGIQKVGPAIWRGRILSA